MLKLLSSHGITMEDCNNIQLFKDYLVMKGHKNKTSYIIQCLAEKYNMGERTVYRVIKRFHEFCREVAVE